MAAHVGGWRSNTCICLWGQGAVMHIRTGPMCWHFPTLPPDFFPIILGCLCQAPQGDIGGHSNGSAQWGPEKQCTHLFMGPGRGDVCWNGADVQMGRLRVVVGLMQKPKKEGREEGKKEQKKGNTQSKHVWPFLSPPFSVFFFFFSFSFFSYYFRLFASGNMRAVLVGACAHCTRGWEAAAMVCIGSQGWGVVMCIKMGLRCRWEGWEWQQTKWEADTSPSSWRCACCTTAPRKIGENIKSGSFLQKPLETFIYKMYIICHNPFNFGYFIYFSTGVGWGRT